VLGPVRDRVAQLLPDHAVEGLAVTRAVQPPEHVVERTVLEQDNDDMVKRGGSGARVRHRDLRSFLDTFKAPAHTKKHAAGARGSLSQASSAPRSDVSHVVIAVQRSVAQVSVADGAEVLVVVLLPEEPQPPATIAITASSAAVTFVTARCRLDTWFVKTGGVFFGHYDSFRSACVAAAGSGGGCLDATEVGQKLGETAGCREFA
jgi:hypothetical protein